MNKGFTLIEVVLTVLLASLVVLALVSIFSSTFRWFSYSFRQDVIQGGTVLSLDTISRDLSKTTYLSSPSSPCGPGVVCPPCPGGLCGGSSAQSSDVLTGCTNYDSALGGPLDPAQNMRAFYGCVDGSGNLQYSWIDGLSACSPPPPIPACGTPIKGGQVMVLARNIERDGTNNACAGPPYPYFCRPAYNNNSVELHYWVSEARSTTTLKVNTSIVTMMPINPP